MDRSLLYTKLHVERRSPINIKDEDLFLFKHELHKVIDEVYLLKEKDVLIINGHLVFNSKRELLKPFSPVIFMPTGSFSKLKFKIKNNLKRTLKFAGRHYWIIDAWSDAYFHWLTDSLPRLISIVNVMGPANILLPDSYEKRKYIADSIRALNCTVSFFTSSSKINVEELISCTQVAVAGNYNPEIIKQVGQTLKQFAIAVSSRNPQGINIYISREKAEKRKLKNEDDIKNILKKYNFQFICLEDLEFCDQVRLVNRAKNVVSVHGAGLTNCMFMEGGGNVLELRGVNDDKNNCYFSLCSVFDLNYYYQVCNYEFEDIYNSDLIIDPVLFETNLLSMLTDC